MLTNRLPKLVLSAALVITALVAFWTIKTSAESEANIPAYTGRGDYQRYESQFFQPESRAPESNSTYVGMGDLRRFEWQMDMLASAAPEPDHPYVGMGDLRRFEALQDIVYHGSP